MATGSMVMAWSVMDQSAATGTADTPVFGDDIRPVRRGTAVLAAHTQGVASQMVQERAERIKRIELAEQMELDAALAASCAGDAKEAAARMDEQMDVHEEVRRGVDVEATVDMDTSAPAPAPAAEHTRMTPMDVDAALERGNMDVVGARRGGRRWDGAAFRSSAAARRAELGNYGRVRGRDARALVARSAAGGGALTDDEGAPGRGRGRSWSHPEKMALCRAWLAVSRDPVIGTDQTSAEFFAAVVDAYRLGFGLPAGLQARSAAAIVRFMRYSLFKNVQLFASVYARVCRRNQTGNLSDEELIRAAEAEIDAGDAYEGVRADPDHDPEEPEPQGRSRARGFRASDWIPSWRILRRADKFSGAAAAAAAATPPRGRGPSAALARVRERRTSAAGEGGEDEDDDGEDEREGDGGREPWRAPEWEAIPIGTKRAKATRSVEIAMQRDCALMARTLGSLAEAANDRVDQSFFFSRWMRDTEDARRWAAAETQRRMLRCRQRLLCAEAADVRGAARLNNGVAASDAASAVGRSARHGRAASPSQTPQSTGAPARAAAAAAPTGADTGSPSRDLSTNPSPPPPSPSPPPTRPSPPPPTLLPPPALPSLTPPPPSPSSRPSRLWRSPPSPPPSPPYGVQAARSSLPVSGVPPEVALGSVARPGMAPRPPFPHERVFPPGLSPATAPIISISSGTSSAAEPLPGVLAVITISSDDSTAKGDRKAAASKTRTDGNEAAEAGGNSRAAAKRSADAKRGANSQATKMRNFIASGPATSGPHGGASRGRAPMHRRRGVSGIGGERDVPDIDDEFLSLALGDNGEEHGAGDM